MGVVDRRLRRTGSWLGLIWLLVLLLVARPVPPTTYAQTGASVAQTAPTPLTETYPYYETDAIAKAVVYLATQQKANGGIDSFGFGTDPGGTARAVYALAAVGYNPTALVSSEGKTMLDFLETQVLTYTYANATREVENLFPGRAGLMLSAVAASGADPTNFGGVNLVQDLNATLRPTGAYSTTAAQGFASGAASAINQSLAIIGLIAAGQPIPTTATDWLIAEQDESGSWATSVDVTGYGVLALIGSGNVQPTDQPIQKALAFYRAQQTPSTALWGDQGRGEPANSSGWTITGLTTAGFLPINASWATGGTNPRAALVGLQNAEGIIAKRFFNAYATLEALYGLTTQPLYFTPRLRTERGLAYLAATQNDDGGFPNFGTASSFGGTLDTVFAFAAAGYNPASITKAGKSPVDYLTSTAAASTRDAEGRVFPAQTGKLLVGVVAVGGDPTSFGGQNLVADLEATLQPTGAYSTTASQGFLTGAASANTQAFAILGLAAAGRTIPTSATDFLVAQQGENGAWGSVDVTGIALQALIAAGRPATDPAITRAVAYLRNTQAATGGWEAFGDISTNSTAYALQGLLAAGVDVNGAEWRKQGRTPISTLASYQKPDGPFVAHWNATAIESGFNPTADNLLATQQALPALIGATYPYKPTGTGTRTNFSPLKRGFDYDSTLAAPAIGRLQAEQRQIQVTIPFGSDLNNTATVSLTWRIAGQPTFTAVPTTRTKGAFVATIDLAGAQFTERDTFEFRTIFRDADSVVLGSRTGTELVAESTLQQVRVYLPLIVRAPASTQ